MSILDGMVIIDIRKVVVKCSLQKSEHINLHQGKNTQRVGQTASTIPM